MTTPSFFDSILASLSSIQLSDIVDILVVAFLFYKGIGMIRSSRGSRIATSIVAVIVLTWITSIFQMYSLNFILSQILEMGAIALVIMFQPELRRLLEKLATKASITELIGVRSPVDNMEKVIADTITACEILSKEKTGVLLVFERKMLLDEYWKTGTVLDAAFSEQLVRNLFFTKAALHDGAVMVRQGRIAAAGCVLPLTDNETIHADLGTRHRAAVGISESSDAVIVVVSEETGTISVAMDGMLKRHLAPKTLERILRSELIVDEAGNNKKGYYHRIKNSLLKKGDDHEA